MRAPAFWDRSADAPGWQSVALSPVSALYAWATARRVRQPAQHDSGRPVICVGNLNAGGTGKTPTVIALIQILSDIGRRPVVLSRGYGGDLTGPVQVDPAHHDAGQVGDEPLLMAAFAPVIVSRERAVGARFIESGDHGDVIVMDDGFQNPALAKDLSLVVVDASRGFGNGRVIPAGPLREPVTAGLSRANLLVTIGDDAAQEAFSRNWGQTVEIPRLTARLEPLPTGLEWEGLRVLAFAGIGYPEKFFATLRDLGAQIVTSHALSDHQPLTSQLMSRLSTEAKAANAQLVTTEKDAVRVPAAYRREVLTLPVRLRFDDPAPLDAALGRILGDQPPSFSSSTFENSE